jgi:hypothetical protein
MLSYHLRENDTVRETLKDGYSAVFFFEGCSDNMDDPELSDLSYYRVSAVCIALKLDDSVKTVITYFNDDCSTLPDRPLEYGAWELEETGEVGPATVCDGTYEIYSVYHGGAYEALHLRTGKPVYRVLFDFWLKIFGIAFGLGVVSGVVMGFQFGTNWSELSRMSGPIQGPLLSYETFTAFMLEASFFGILVFGRSLRAAHRVPHDRRSGAHGLLLVGPDSLRLFCVSCQTGDTPISIWCKPNTNAAYTARPTTTVTTVAPADVATAAGCAT